MNQLNVATRRVTPPEEFPVIWPKPDFENYHWTRDREHMPDPLTPMFFSAARVMAIAGRERTVPVYDEAIVQRYDFLFNYYIYTCIIPFDGTPEELAARAKRNHNKVSAVSFRLKAVWEQEWRPLLEAHWDFWAAFDLEAADLPALREHLDESIRRGTDLYQIHYLMGPPMWFAIDAFERFYCDLFPGATPLQAHRLLQGSDNKTLEIGRALWALRDRARAVPAVQRIILAEPTAQVLPALAGCAEGREFLTALREFLRAYGGRSDLWDWGYPSWEDDPAPVINNLKNYLAQPDRDLRAELTRAAAEREVAIAAARQSLAGYPQPVRERFEVLLDAAQTALVLTENHTYYIDFNGFGWIHRIVYECGRRLAQQNALDAAADVFYLTLEELQAALVTPAPDCRAAARERRAEVTRWAAYDEPRELGLRPAEPLYLYSPDARRMLRYVGGFAATEDAPVAEAGTLRGQGGSAGRARGTARVILTLADAHRLQPGDILVTRTTAPPWTPLFLTAAAVVTDAGGMLSHGAVVSREYGIPAVVGAYTATTHITDSQEIEVDGDAGIVYLL